MADDPLPEFVKRKPGWPKGKPRPVRAKPIEADPVRANRGHKFKYEDFSQFDGDDEEDRLKIPRDQIPDGIDLQWVTDSIRGMPYPERRATFERKGWEAVMMGDFEGRFDHFMPKTHSGEIRVDDLVLCCRPMELTVIARRKDKIRAGNQVAIKEAQLRGGDIPKVGFDTQHQSARRSTKVNKTYEAYIPPSDDE